MYLVQHDIIPWGAICFVLKQCEMYRHNIILANKFTMLLKQKLQRNFEASEQKKKSKVEKFLMKIKKEQTL